jgi:hypothetical protein
LPLSHDYLVLPHIQGPPPPNSQSPPTLPAINNEAALILPVPHIPNTRIANGGHTTNAAPVLKHRARETFVRAKGPEARHAVVAVRRVRDEPAVVHPPLAIAAVDVAAAAAVDGACVGVVWGRGGDGAGEGGSCHAREGEEGRELHGWRLVRVRVG